MIPITANLSIPENELRFQVSRSGGPGGQNVNKLNTRVALLFDVERSEALTERQKVRVKRRLSRRINKDGVLRIVSQENRTQIANKKEVLLRFQKILATALRVPRKRVPTAVPVSSRLQRLENKRMHGQLKKLRSRPVSLDE